MPEMPIIPNN